MGRLGMTEILVCVALFVLLFGAKKFSDLGKGLGEGIRNFKKGIKEDESEPSKQLTPAKEDGAPADKEDRPLADKRAA